MNYKTEIKVTRINNNYHARLFVNDVLYDEMACNNQMDIGYICREMLRWADKMGICNEHTASARTRQTQAINGTVWKIKI